MTTTALAPAAVKTAALAPADYGVNARPEIADLVHEYESTHDLSLPFDESPRRDARAQERRRERLARVLGVGAMTVGGVWAIYFAQLLVR